MKINYEEDSKPVEKEGTAPNQDVVQPETGSVNHAKHPDAGVGETSPLTPQQRKLLEQKLHRKSYPNGVDILAMVGIILISSLAAGVIISVLGLVTKLDSGMINALAYLLQFALAIGFIALQRRSRCASVNVLKFRSGRLSAPLILWGIVLIFVTGIVIEPLLNLFPDKYMEFLNQTIGTGGWAILTTVVLAPILEETLFRGLIQGSIAERDGAVKGILISALIFGVVHFIPQQAINAFFIGIILGYIYYRTGSLLTVMILHALNNGISYLQLELLGEDAIGMTTRNLIGNDSLYYIVYGISLALVVVGAVAIIRNLHRQDKLKKIAEEGHNTLRTE